MGFSNSVISEVWEKAKMIQGVNPNVKRKDKCGATIAKSAYEDHNSGFGWHVDYIKPVSKGGTDALSNLQPIHWNNNASKGNRLDNPSEYCVIKK